MEDRKQRVENNIEIMKGYAVIDNGIVHDHTSR